MARAASLIGLLLFATSARAADLPASCTAADRAKAIYLKRVGSDPITLQDRLLGSSDSNAEVAMTRENVAQSQLQAAARMCVGDLVAERRLDEAVTQSLRYGLSKDAIALQKQADALKAKGPPF